MSTLTFDKEGLPETLKNILSEAGQFGPYPSEEFEGNWEIDNGAERLVYRRATAIKILSPDSVREWLCKEAATQWGVAVDHVCAAWSTDDEGREVVVVEENDIPRRSFRDLDESH